MRKRRLVFIPLCKYITFFPVHSSIVWLVIRIVKQYIHSLWLLLFSILYYLELSNSIQKYQLFSQSSRFFSFWGIYSINFIVFLSWGSLLRLRFNFNLRLLKVRQNVSASSNILRIPGEITLSLWCHIVTKVTGLSLPWRTLASKLVLLTPDNLRVRYNSSASMVKLGSARVFIYSLLVYVPERVLFYKIS